MRTLNYTYRGLTHRTTKDGILANIANISKYSANFGGNFVGIALYQGGAIIEISTSKNSHACVSHYYFIINEFYLSCLASFSDSVAPIGGLKIPIVFKNIFILTEKWLTGPTICIKINVPISMY